MKPGTPEHGRMPGASCNRFVTPFNFNYFSLRNLNVFRNTVFTRRSRVTSNPRTVITLYALKCEDLTILASTTHVSWLLNIIYLEGISSYDFIIYGDRDSLLLNQIGSVRIALEESFQSGHLPQG